MTDTSTWRAHAAQIIRRVLETHRNESAGAIAAALEKAYPYQGDVTIQYKIWLEELARQRGPRRQTAAAVPQEALFP